MNVFWIIRGSLNLVEAWSIQQDENNVSAKCTARSLAASYFIGCWTFILKQKNTAVINAKETWLSAKKNNTNIKKQKIKTKQNQKNNIFTW
jgi:hypothetical protein